MARPKSIILVGAPGSGDNQAQELEKELQEIERGIRSEKEALDKHIKGMKARAEILEAKLAQLKNEEKECDQP